MSADAAVRRAIRRGERAGAAALLKELRRRFGLLGAARILVQVAFDKLRGESFAELGKPQDDRDALSRRQCGDVLLVARAVRQRAGDEAALEVARAAVIGGAAPFLEAMIPHASDQPLAELGPRLSAQFFNAEGEGRSDGEAYLFDVSRCRFVELCRAAGQPELAPLFCEVDELFFDGRRRPVVLRRSGTLATGADRCDFRFEPRG